MLPEPSLLQAKQSQLSQPLLVCQMFQSIVSLSYSSNIYLSKYLEAIPPHVTVGLRNLSSTGRIHI